MARIILQDANNGYANVEVPCFKVDYETIKAKQSSSGQVWGSDYTCTKTEGTSESYEYVRFDIHIAYDPARSDLNTVYFEDIVVDYLGFPLSLCYGASINNYFLEKTGTINLSLYGDNHTVQVLNVTSTNYANGDTIQHNIGNFDLGGTFSISSLDGNFYDNQEYSPGFGTLLACKTNDKSAGGYYLGAVWSSAGYYAGYSCTIVMWKKLSLARIHKEIEPDQGDGGFKPIGNYPSKTIGGGDISGVSPTYPTDIISQPGAPDESEASVVGSGFLRMYKITKSDLAKVGECLWGSTFLTSIANLFINPLDAICALNVFPCRPNVGSLEAIKLLGHTCTTADLGTNANGFPLSNQFKTIDFGTLSVAEMWQSFLDYEATSFELYLPFIGSVDIDVSEVMGGSINVQYTVDFLTGMCVANVLCTKSTYLSNDTYAPQYSQHTYQGNCAVQIPLSNVSYGSMIGALIQAGCSGLTSGPGGMFASLGESALSGAFKPSVTSKGTISANAGFCSILYPYICITRPITAESASYQEVIGYPSYIDTKLATCEGLCVCDGIDLDGIPYATDNECKRIEQMCKEGIYI